MKFVLLLIGFTAVSLLKGVLGYLQRTALLFEFDLKACRAKLTDWTANA